jgi:uncharacterized protein (DUF1330 family)
MKAYVIVEIEVKEPVRYETYKEKVPASLAPYGGRFIVRGGRAETLEGSWSPRRLVVVEFPSYENAKAWWASEEYAPAKTIRQATASTHMIVVEGFLDNVTPKLS